MTREIFLKIMRQQRDLNDFVDKIENILKCEIFESLPIETAWNWFDTILNEAFTSEGVDYIYSYLYDYDGQTAIEITDNATGELIAAYNDIELWDLLNKLNCIKCN